MDRDRLIKDFYDLFLEEKTKASFFDELREGKAETLINKLQYPLWLINDKLGVWLRLDEDNTHHLLVITHDNTDEIADIADEIEDKAPKIDNWIICSEPRSMKGPIFEYDPLGSESNPEPYLDNVYLSIVPVNPRAEGPMLNLYIYMNEMESENLQRKIEFLIPTLLGITRYTEWIKSVSFIDYNEIVPNDAILFKRSDLWIEFMKNCIKQL